MLETAPQENQGEEMVVSQEVIEELGDKVLERLKTHPDEDELTALKRVVNRSTKIPHKDRDHAREEVSAELMRRKNSDYQKRIDAKHDNHWTVKAGLDD